MPLGSYSYAHSFARHVEYVGRYCSIGGGLQTYTNTHPVDRASTSPVFYQRRKFREWGAICWSRSSRLRPRSGSAMMSGSERPFASGKASASVTVQSLQQMLWSRKTWHLLRLWAGCRRVLSGIALIPIYRLPFCSWNGGGTRSLISFPFSRTSQCGSLSRLRRRWQRASCSPGTKIVFFSATCCEPKYQVEPGIILTPTGSRLSHAFELCAGFITLVVGFLCNRLLRVVAPRGEF